MNAAHEKTKVRANEGGKNLQIVKQTKDRLPCSDGI